MGITQIVSTGFQRPDLNLNC